MTIKTLYIFILLLIANFAGAMSSQDKKLCDAKKRVWPTEEKLVDYHANYLAKQCADKVKDEKAYKSCYNKAKSDLSRARDNGPNCYK